MKKLTALIGFALISISSNIVLALPPNPNNQPGKCIEGSFEVPAYDSKATYNFRFKGSQGALGNFKSLVTNPDAEITDAEDGKQKKISDLFKSDDMDILKQEGVKCPCDVYVDESDSFQLIIEGDQVKINYFGLPTKNITLKSCPDPKTTTPNQAN